MYVYVPERNHLWQNFQFCVDYPFIYSIFSDLLLSRQVFSFPHYLVLASGTFLCFNQVTLYSQHSIFSIHSTNEKHSAKQKFIMTDSPPLFSLMIFPSSGQWLKWAVEVAVCYFTLTFTRHSHTHTHWPQCKRIINW